METMTASTGHELTDAEPNSVYEQKHQTDAALIKHSQSHQGETTKIQRGMFSNACHRHAEDPAMRLMPNLGKFKI